MHFSYWYGWVLAVTEFPGGRVGGVVSEHSLLAVVLLSSAPTVDQQWSANCSTAMAIIIHLCIVATYICSEHLIGSVLGGVMRFLEPPSVPRAHFSHVRESSAMSSAVQQYYTCTRQCSN